ncbi:elongator complex protein 3 [Desnuesiella massiliensis]|uniref:elongator complex protein 3 n=1 Tax=Desnuesiella massiliensis TaxID=1650662 RepID=UPI0006E36704|nr:radical SAM protein [Desnuesiella massiliensis]
MSKRHYIIPIFVPHEGCPHNCVFCNQNRISGEEERVTKDQVINTIEEYLSTMDRQNSTIEISFFGGTFTAINIDKQNELLSIAQSYKQRGLIDYIRLSTRPDYIDDFILSNLKKHSVDIIELGIQSMDSEVLNKSGRGHSEEQVYGASQLIKQYNFVLGHQIMVGLPGDSYEKDIETTKKVISMKPDICRIYPALVIKDTPMEIMYKKGDYKPYDLDQALYICKIIYGMLISRDIKVIRVGLQTTDNINEGKDIIAGPFHPAFRELMESILYNEIIVKNVEKDSDKVEIIINPKNLSKLYSNRKKYFYDMVKQINAQSVKITVSDYASIDIIQIVQGDKCCQVSINEYLKKNY